MFWPAIMHSARSEQEIPMRTSHRNGNIRMMQFDIFCEGHTVRHLSDDLPSSEFHQRPSQCMGHLYWIKKYATQFKGHIDLAIRELSSAIVLAKEVAAPEEFITIRKSIGHIMA